MVKKSIIVVVAVLTVLASSSIALYAVITSWNYSPKPIKFEVETPPLIRDFGPMSDVLYVALIDGLRSDVALQIAKSNSGALGLAYLEGFWLGNVRTVMPSVSPAVRASVFTGAPPELHGVVGYGYESTNLTFPIDNVFAGAESKGLVSYVVADPLVYGEFWEWSRGIRAQWLPDAETHSIVSEVIKGDPPDFLYVCYVSTDDAGHKYGGASTEYAETAKRASEFIAEDLEALSATNKSYIAIVFSDHGHLDEGGHGGEEPEVLTVFAAFLGRNVLHDARPDQLPVYFLGPTISFVLGVNLPAYSMAPPFFDAFNASEERKAAYMLQYAELKVRQIIGLGKTIDLAPQELSYTLGVVNETIKRARNEFLKGNMTGSFELSRIAASMGEATLRHLLSRAESRVVVKRVLVTSTILAVYASLVAIFLRFVGVSRRDILEGALLSVAHILALIALLYATGIGLSMSKFDLHRPLPVTLIAISVLVPALLMTLYLLLKHIYEQSAYPLSLTFVLGLCISLVNGVLLGQPVMSWSAFLLSISVLTSSAIASLALLIAWGILKLRSRLIARRGMRRSPTLKMRVQQTH